jgi:hypothetical protein
MRSIFPRVCRGTNFSAAFKAGVAFSTPQDQAWRASGSENNLDELQEHHLFAAERQAGRASMAVGMSHIKALLHRGMSLAGPVRRLLQAQWGVVQTIPASLGGWLVNVYTKRR